jgi:acetyltransferase-like isoleucine patch superfamily enzyme
MLIKKKRIPVLHMLLIGVLPSFFKKLVYRTMGYTIGKNVTLSFGSAILGRNVHIKDNAKVGFFTIIRGREITIGRFVKIGSMSFIDTEKIFIDEDARINEQVYIGGMRTPQSSFHLGKRTIIMQMSYINPTLPVFIDDDSGIGGHCLLFTHGSWNSQLEGYPVRFAPIHIGKKVWLPWRVFVMPGVTMGDHIVVGANSLISSDVPSNSFIAGSPAKVMKQNVPVEPDQESKEKMLHDIFEDFFNFLRYEDIVCEVDKNSEGFVAKVRGKQSGSIKYCTSGIISEAGNSSTMILFLKATPEILQEAIDKGYGMAASISDNMRIGSNDSGEELITFFSRYGVRFSRLN